MTENNQSEQPFHPPHETGLGAEQTVNDVKKNQRPYKRTTHIPLDPREDYFKK